MQDILPALRWRYAVKLFDPHKKVSEEDLRVILEAGRLAPSSTGLEPWKFILVENPELRVKLRAVSYDQPKVTDAAHIMVIARRLDVRENLANELIARTVDVQNVDPASLGGLRAMAEGGIKSRDDRELDAWIRSQVYIPLGLMVEAAALLGVDTCPMEGFKSDEVDRLLNLPARRLASTVMLALGYRGEDPAAKRAKVRRPFEEVVEFIR